MALDQGSFSVFSTYVEMIPKAANPIVARISVLHVCGDDPKQKSNKASADKCSPRMWR